MTGVYCIKNTKNGKVYVGSAALSVRDRWSRHRRELRAGTHTNRHLQAAWMIDGESAFEFVVLLECCSLDCLEKEQYYIDSLKSANRQYGYNVLPTAGSRIGAKWSEEEIVRRASRRFLQHRPAGSFEIARAFKKAGKQTDATKRIISLKKRGTGQWKAKVTEETVKDIRAKYRDEWRGSRLRWNSLEILTRSHYPSISNVSVVESGCTRYSF